MEKVKLKVCGMKHPENILEVSALQPDYMGFIFYEKSPRFFDAEIPQIPSEIKKIGVFVDSSVDFITEKTQKHGFDFLQLHGNESADYCKTLRAKLADHSIKIIKVFSIKEAFDFSKLRDYEGIVDYFLFDTKGKTKGGTGRTFNWEVLKKYPSSTPFFLSGGIGLEQAEEVKELISWFQKNGKENLLHALDVNSKFEDEPGLKNIEKLRKFTRL